MDKTKLCPRMPEVSMVPEDYEHLISCNQCQKEFADEFRMSTEVTAYLVPYEVVRLYGGPEEGGWWYDAFQYQQVSIPFHATVVYEKRELNEEAEFTESEENGWSSWEDTQNPPGPLSKGVWGWVPVHIKTSPSVTQVAFRASAEAHCATLYPTGTSHRGSMAQREADYTLNVEVGIPGQLSRRPRPRYY